MAIAEDLFGAALHLQHPWYISDLKFLDDGKKLQIWIDFYRGSRFACPHCGKTDCEVHDTALRTWRHLDFFEYQTYLHCRVPRVSCPNCGIHQAIVPWARKRSGFTLLLEGLIVFFAQTMQMTQISEKLKIPDKRIWRVVAYHVHEALSRVDLSAVKFVGVDETSRKKGHKYISTIADLISGKIIYICKGKDSAVLKSFSDFFIKHEGKKENIDLVCCDMSPAFIKGICDQLPGAAIIFDKFHVMKMVNQAVDEVRREEQKSNRFLKKTRFLWLKNPKNLTERQQKELGSLKDMNLKTTRAYNLKLSFQMFWTISDPNLAENYLKKWFFWATHSKLQPFISLAYTIKDHWRGILNYFTHKVTNGLLEGLNSLIQSLKANARGYCNDDNFMTMIYLRHGPLDLHLPI